MVEPPTLHEDPGIPPNLRHPPRSASKTWSAWPSPPEFVNPITRSSHLVTSLMVLKLLRESLDAGFTHTKCGKSLRSFFSRAFGCGNSGDYVEDLVTSYTRSWRSTERGLIFQDRSGLFPRIGRNLAFFIPPPQLTHVGPAWWLAFRMIIHPPLTNCCRRRHHSRNSSSSRRVSNWWLDPHLRTPTETRSDLLSASGKASFGCE